MKPGITPGGRHEWVETPRGLVRKPLRREVHVPIRIDDYLPQDAARQVPMRRKAGFLGWLRRLLIRFRISRVPETRDGYPLGGNGGGSEGGGKSGDK